MEVQKDHPCLKKKPFKMNKMILKNNHKKEANLKSQRKKRKENKDWLKHLVQQLCQVLDLVLKPCHNQALRNLIPNQVILN